MLLNKLMIASFFALSHEVSAAPIKFRTRDHLLPVYSSNGSDAATDAAAKPVFLSGGSQIYARQSADGESAGVIGVSKMDELVVRKDSSANGDLKAIIKAATAGNSGKNSASNINSAVPIIISKGKGGYIYQSLDQTNTAEQQTNGADSNGGNSSAVNINSAVPIIISKGKGGYIYQDVNQNNTADQIAGGGDSVGGTNSANNTNWAAPIIISKGKGGYIYQGVSQTNTADQEASGVDSNGGANNVSNTNLAAPIIISKGKGGYIYQGVSQTNTADQDASGGGSAAAIR